MTTSQNPLTARGLTPDQYARAHRAAQAKASWLLQDQQARLDREIAQENTLLDARLQDQRTQLEIRAAKAEEANEALRAEYREARAERKRLRSRRDHHTAAIKVLQSELDALQALRDETTARREELDQLKAENAQLTRDIKATQGKAARLRGKAQRAEQTLKRREDFIKYAPMTEEDRRLFDAGNEVAAHAARKRRAAAGTPGALLAG